MTEDPNPERAFFGRRKARPLKKSRVVLLRELLPRLNIDIETPVPDKISTLFETKSENHVAIKPPQMILEIGFGGGEHLIQRASEQPGNHFIGCEPFIDGMGKALLAIHQTNLANIRLFDKDAILLLDWQPEASIDTLYLLYPDPWPKKRHWKRRFVNPKNLARIARVIKPGGEFRFASDIAHYVNWTLLACRDFEGLEWTANNAKDWHQPWAGWQSTRYEKKAIREGRQSAYLTFSKV